MYKNFYHQIKHFKVYIGRYGSTMLIRHQNYIKSFNQCNFDFSGMSPDNLLPEILESKSHQWFIGVQFHPELKSRPFDPHPLFVSFIKAAVKRSRLI